MHKILILLLSMSIPIIGFAQGQISRPQKHIEPTHQSVLEKSTSSSTSSKQTRILSEPTGYKNNYGYVDLGLPSGTMWSSMNLGASKPEDIGELYKWGETVPDQRVNCTYGKDISDISAKRQYDAAFSNWGTAWRIPTDQEMSELINNCTWEWINYNGVCGYKVIGPNGNSIFFPSDKNNHGDYWSATSDKNNTACSYRLQFVANVTPFISEHGRYGSLYIRPVTSK